MIWVEFLCGSFTFICSITAWNGYNLLDTTKEDTNQTSQVIILLLISYIVHMPNVAELLHHCSEQTLLKLFQVVPQPLVQQQHP